MDPSGVKAFIGSVGAARLQPYLARYAGNEEAAIRLYVWNIEASSAFLGPLGVLEVALRNAMHDELRKSRGDAWWLTQRVHLAPYEANMLKKAHDKLASAGNTLPTPDDVIGATSFGFWVGMLSPGIARDRRYDYETVMWPKVSGAFTGSGTLGRKQVHAGLDRVRKFRNRVAHNEPIFGANLEQLRDLILGCCGLIHPDLADFVDKSHTVDEVIKRKQAAVVQGQCRI